MTTALPSSLVLVGAGKMGAALLEGWIAAGLEPGAAAIVEPAPAETLAALCAAHGLALNPPAGRLAAPEALVLAVKPQALAAAASTAAALVGPGTLVLSILAGKTIADIGAALGQARAIVRAMPNLPASIRRGITAAVASPATEARQKAFADALLGAVGAVEWLDDEDLLDAVTAVSGSGPAYVFLLTECLARAAHSAGLPADLAERLARATVTGAGELLARSDMPAGRLRQDVTSPGGTTAAALDLLMSADGLEPLLTRAVAAAKRRAAELSG